MTRRAPLQIVTRISVPQGTLSEAVQRTLVQQVVDTLGWINPERFGHITPSNTFGEGETKDERRRRLLDSFRQHGDLEMSQRKGSVAVSLTPRKDLAGSVLLVTPAGAQLLELTAHRDAVWTLMNAVRAPLAIAADADAYEATAWRAVESDFGRELEITVKDYTHGLERAHWRMWFAEPFVSFFGRESLARAPALHTDVRTEGVFVQLYERASDWDTPTGRDAERRFVQAVGEGAFYDPSRPDRGLDHPDFGSR